MKDKGKFFGILLPIVMVLVIAGVVLACSGVFRTQKLTLGDVLSVEAADIEHIRVSQEQYYLDDYSDALWTDVWEEDAISAIHEAICAVAVEQGDGIDDTLAGGSPRYVNCYLKDGSCVELKFVDDAQVWINEVCWHFKNRGALYEALDEILAGREYTKAPGA